MDDFFIYGKTENEHDRNLTNFLNRSRECGLKIGADEIPIRKHPSHFMDYSSQWMD